MRHDVGCHRPIPQLIVYQNDFLEEQNPHGAWLFEEFGFAEVVFTPILMRVWFLEYYEGFPLPACPEFDRVRRWRDACLNYLAAQQVTQEEIVKAYYDYAPRGLETAPCRRAGPSRVSPSSHTGPAGLGRHLTSTAQTPRTWIWGLIG